MDGARCRGTCIRESPIAVSCSDARCGPISGHLAGARAGPEGASLPVFISYASHDRSHASAISEALESAGVSTWIAPRDIAPGAAWGDAIIAAITASTTMLVVLSRNADASRQVVREVSQAVDRGIRVIPVRIEDRKPTGAMAYLLDTQQWLDAFPAPLAAHLPRVVASVSSLGNEMPEPQPPTQPFIEAVPDRWTAEPGRRRWLRSLFEDR